MVLRGLVLLCPSLSLDTVILSRLTVERRVWSYGVCCAPSFPSILPYSVVLMIEGRSLV